MERDRKETIAYARYLALQDPNDDTCQFCNPKDSEIELVAEYQHCYVMANRFPYSHWELRKVTEHLMIVPRRHVLSLSDLDPAESQEFVSLVGDYEQQGYDIFARAPTSSTRSVVHQHTHLIKAEDKWARGALFWRKPYILKLFG